MIKSFSCHVSFFISLKRKEIGKQSISKNNFVKKTEL